MKRFVCLILALLMMVLLFPAAVAEEEFVLRLEGSAGNVGDTVSVAVKVENAPECASLSAYIVYDDTMLEPVGCIEGETNGLIMEKLNETYGGQPAVRITVTSDGNAFSGDTTVCTFTFRILAETPGDFGTKLKAFITELTAIGDEKIYNPAMDKWVYPVYDLQVDWIDGCRVAVGNDFSEALTTAHAVRIMQDLIGLEVDTDLEILDQNGDQSLTIADAVLILRKLNA